MLRILWLRRLLILLGWLSTLRRLLLIPLVILLLIAGIACNLKDVSIRDTTLFLLRRSWVWQRPSALIHLLAVEPLRRHRIFTRTLRLAIRWWCGTGKFCNVSLRLRLRSSDLTSLV